MFSPETITRLRGEVLLRRTAFDELTEKAEAAEASLDEWSQLLAHAEAYAEPEPKPLSVPSKLAPEAWCSCGLSGTPGMVHGITVCVVSKTDPTPTLPQLLGAPAEGAWFGNGRPPYARGATTP